ncbi:MULTISPECIES: hypothetical protein [unclassified Microcoleus]|nr:MULTISPECIES: hypothetical protein [unclassified Microcoleus]
MVGQPQSKSIALTQAIAQMAADWALTPCVGAKFLERLAERAVR